MPTIVITPKELGPALRREGKRGPAAVKAAGRAASWRLKRHIVQAIDKAGITDEGVLKGGIRVIETGARGNVQTTSGVTGDAPHTGIIELGARPHPVSAEGREAIKAWCMRKLDLDEKEAERATFLICRKIAREGAKGHHIFRDSMPFARTYFAEELVRILNAGASRPQVQDFSDRGSDSGGAV